ncbi:uncharacterized protein LOC124887213 [Capsicum annuum]|uniref:uncharacterized protein LOC124887213 n=1 Tax=Capsicum annuum TaxID=4072 RepID=UPI001FB13107|nr:uncharacterized protein LOC124887213 [Capsicum annuum]
MEPPPIPPPMISYVEFPFYPGGSGTNNNGGNEIGFGCFHATPINNGSSTDPTTNEFLCGVLFLPPTSTRSDTMDLVVHHHVVHGGQLHACANIPSKDYSSNYSSTRSHAFRKSGRNSRNGRESSGNHHARISSLGSGTRSCRWVIRWSARSTGSKIG